MLLTMSTEAPMFSIIYAGARPEIGYIGRRDKHQWRLPGVGKDQLVGWFHIWTHRINGMNGIFIIYLHLYTPIICPEVERDKQLQPNSCWLALGSHTDACVFCHHAQHCRSGPWLIHDNDKCYGMNQVPSLTNPPSWAAIEMHNLCASSLLPFRSFQVVWELAHTKTIAIGMAHGKGDPWQHRFRPYLDRDGWPLLQCIYIVDVWCQM